MRENVTSSSVSIPAALTIARTGVPVRAIVFVELRDVHCLAIQAGFAPPPQPGFTVRRRSPDPSARIV